MLADYRTAPIDERLRGTLGFLQAVTLAPDEPIERPEGVSSGALVDALYVAAYFNVIDRLADSLGFELPSAAEHAEYAPRFLQEGYGNEV